MSISQGKMRTDLSAASDVTKHARSHTTNPETAGSRHISGKEGGGVHQAERIIDYMKSVS